MNMETFDLKISGMGSAHCVGVVKNIVNNRTALQRWDIKLFNKCTKDGTTWFKH